MVWSNPYNSIQYLPGLSLSDLMERILTDDIARIILDMLPSPPPPNPHAYPVEVRRDCVDHHVHHHAASQGTIPKKDRLWREITPLSESYF